MRNLFVQFLWKANRVREAGVRKTYVDESTNLMARAFTVINLALDDWRRSDRKLQAKGLEKRKSLVKALTIAAYQDLSFRGPDSFWVETVVETLGETISWGTAFRFALQQHNECLVQLSTKTCILLYKNLYQNDYEEELEALHEMIMQLDICDMPDLAEIMLDCCMNKFSEHVEIGEKLFAGLTQALINDVVTPNLLVIMLEGYVRVREYAKAEKVIKLAKRHDIEVPNLCMQYENFWGWLLFSDRRVPLSQAAANDLLDEAGSFGNRGSIRRMALHALCGDLNRVMEEFSKAQEDGVPTVDFWNCYVAAMLRGNQNTVAQITLRRMRDDLDLFDDFTDVLWHATFAIEDDDDDEPQVQKEKDPLQRPKLSESDRKYVRDQLLTLGGSAQQVPGLENRERELLLKDMFSHSNEMRE